MEATNYKFCPSCKLRNPGDAVVCEHCGTPLVPAGERLATTRDVDKETRSLPKDLEQEIEPVHLEAPSEGIAIFVAGRPAPIEVRLENEFIIGRSTETTEGNVVDLTPYDAYALGVSRQHLMVHRTARECTVVDLNSANGTWVNEQRLPPQLHVPVKSGSQIRLGNLRLFIAFRTT